MFPSHVLESKIDTGAPQGRLILPFWWFLGEVEKSSFFDEAPGRRKIDKNRSLERPGAEKDAPGNTECTVPAAMGSLIKEKRD